MISPTKKKSPDPIENPYWMSFSDILSALLIVFILATVIVVYELMSTKRLVDQNLNELAKAESVRKTILEEIKEDLENEGIKVLIADNFTVLRIPEETLTFPTNSYALPTGSQQINDLRRIGSSLYRAITKENRSVYLDTIFIEGHTDIRSSSREFGNWGLSTYRAISVWQYWTNEVESRLSTLKNASGEPLFSVSGYGETRPVTKKQRTAFEYRQNRRLDLRITVRKPKATEFAKIEQMLR